MKFVLSRFVLSSLVAAALATFAACSLTTTAHAQTLFTNAAKFHTVAPATTVYDFENLARTGFAVNPSLPTLSFLVNGGSDTHVYAASGVFGRGAYSLDGSSSLLAGLGGRSGSVTTRIDLGESYTAFAVEMGQSGNKTNRYVLRLYKGDTQVGLYCDMGARQQFFVGVTSAVPFDNVRITTCNPSGSYTVFDNVQVGNTAPNTKQVATRN